MIKFSSCISLALSASILLFSSAFAQIPVLGIDFGDDGVTPSEQGSCGSSVATPGTGFIQTIEITPNADGTSSSGQAWNKFDGGITLNRDLANNEKNIWMAYGPVTPVSMENFPDIKEVYIDGKSHPIVDGYFALPSGQHNVTFAVNDEEPLLTFNIMISPYLFMDAPVVAVKQGEKAELTVRLSGDAINYPVVANYSIWNDSSEKINSGVINITAGRSASFEIDTTAAIIDLCSVKWQIKLDSASNAEIKTSERSLLIIDPNERISKRLHLNTIQSANAIYKRRVIFKKSGLVSVFVTIEGEDSAMPNFDWSQSDNRLAPINGWDQSSFEFDPSELAPDVYSIAVQTVETATSPLMVVESIINIIDASVINEPSSLTAEDRNDNGILDVFEATTAAYVISLWCGKNNHYFAFTEPGLTLALGELAFAGQNHQAALADQQVKALINDDISPESSFESAGSIDVMIRELAIGGHANLIMPLNQHADRLFVYDSSSDSWHKFDSSGEEERDKALTVYGATGICPFTFSDSYQEVDDHYFPCVKLFIKDGGANDGDGKENGQIALRLVARATLPPPLPEKNNRSEAAVNSEAAPDNNSGNGGGVLLWSIMFLLLWQTRNYLSS